MNSPIFKTYIETERTDALGIKLVLPIILSLVSLTVLSGERATSSASIDETAERKRAVAQCKLAAARFKRDKDKTAAREAFITVAQIDPTYPMPLFYLGALADVDGRKDEAIQYYEKFVKLDDQSDSFVTAQLRLDELRKPSGAQSPKAAEPSVNTQYDVEVAKAQRLNNEGKWTEAAGLAAGAIKLAPKRWEAYLVAGASNAKQKQFDIAGAQLKAAFDLESLPVNKKAAVANAIERCGKEGEAQALVNQATGALNSKNYQVAGDQFSQAFAILPEMEDWGWSAALAFAVAQKYDSSVKLLTTLSASKNTAMAQQAAEKLIKVKSLIVVKSPNDKTSDAYDAKNATSPDSKFDIKMKVGSVAREKRDLPTAERAFMDALSLKPHDPQATAALAEVESCKQNLYRMAKVGDWAKFKVTTESSSSSSPGKDTESKSEQIKLFKVTKITKTLLTVQMTIIKSTGAGEVGTTTNTDIDLAIPNEHRLAKDDFRDSGTGDTTVMDTKTRGVESIKLDDGRVLVTDTKLVESIRNHDGALRKSHDKTVTTTNYSWEVPLDGMVERIHSSIRSSESKTTSFTSDSNYFGKSSLLDFGFASDTNAAGAAGISPKAGSIDKDVEYATGMQFFNGSAVAKDYAKALPHLRRAADLGHGEATQQVAEIYCHGYGVEENQAIGVSWHKKAVAMGNVPAEVSLGGHYLNGQGVQEDVNAGVSWYKSAAGKNSDEAFHQLGHLYEKGLGVLKNENEAIRLFKLAAEQGNYCAQNSLGAKYELGIAGLKKDFGEAFSWYEKAAVKGHIEAQYNLGMLYMRGRGVEKDSDKAIEWFSKAATSGHESAKKELKRLQK